MGKIFLLSDLIVITVFTSFVSISAIHAEEPADKSDKWTAELPNEAKDPKPWTTLTQKLIDSHLDYSALTAASRMLLFFPDLSTKEFAYRAVIALVDRGYPYSTHSLFLSGDIEPRQENNFSNSYNLYKAILNKEKGMEKWAENYFATVDKEHFSKFFFYQALESYQAGDLTTARSLLEKILNRGNAANELPFIRKATRTLARVYFDQGRYENSLEIYKTFLLRLNPLEPSDFLEAAWNAFHLKKYSEALGYLYNLEAPESDLSLSLEKYMLRALIHRNLCNIERADELIAEFNKAFSSIIAGIKRGEPLQQFPQLKKIIIGRNNLFHQVTDILSELETERKSIPHLTPEEALILKYVYESETQLLRQKMRTSEEKALENAANQIITMGEQLKFLRYGVVREKFNPNTVFRPDELTAETLVTDVDGNRFQIRWPQMGDFWRDERLHYQGLVENKCSS